MIRGMESGRFETNIQEEKQTNIMHEAERKTRRINMETGAHTTIRSTESQSFVIT